MSSIAYTHVECVVNCLPHTHAVMMGQFASNLGGTKPAKTQTPNWTFAEGTFVNGPAPRHSAKRLRSASETEYSDPRFMQ
jgi:hypothetical protein